MFTPRLTRPESGNKYYITRDSGGYSTAIKGYPKDALCNTLANCVGYAVGRFHEIANRPQFDLVDPVNAENIFSNAQQHGLKTGTAPALGALIVWQKGATLSGSDGAGHVAVVEKINADGSIITSESGYGAGNPFWTSSYNPPYSYKKEYKFLGFVYQPNGGKDMTKKGIDISYCQKTVNWDNVDADFVIARAGYGRYTTQKDTMFESHYAGAKKRGIPVGVYWYSYAKTVEDAKLEADACLEVIKGKQYEYPIFYDVEEPTQLALGKDKVSAIIEAFLSRVEQAGYWVGLYGSYSMLSSLVSDKIRNRYTIWLAHWDVQKSPYTGKYDVWQYKVGSAAGVNGQCDLDYSYADFETQIKAKGLNGFGKEPDPPVPDTKYIEIKIDGETWAGNLTKKV